MDQFIKVAGTEGKVGGYFCRLPPLNENTATTVLPVPRQLKFSKVIQACVYYCILHIKCLNRADNDRTLVYISDLVGSQPNTSIQWKTPNVRMVFFFSIILVVQQ